MKICFFYKKKEKGMEAKYESALKDVENWGIKFENFGCKVIFQENKQKENDYVLYLENPEKEYTQKRDKTIQEVYSISRSIAKYVQSLENKTKK